MDRTAATANSPRYTPQRFDYGVNHESIAERLRIGVEAVKPLLRIAAAKLEHILAADDPI
jgi:hypothetical protein